MAGPLTEEESRDKVLLGNVLEIVGYDMRKAGEILGVHETTVLRRVRRYGLEPELVARNPRAQARRTIQPHDLPGAPTRQALEQKRNREAGLCGCGKPIEPEALTRRKAVSCANCRARWRKSKVA
jgi:hypothetical protein